MAHGPTRELLADRNYLRFWFARILSAMSFQIIAVAVGWLVYDRTGSAYALGLVGLAQYLPLVVLMLVVGVVVDRYDRRLVVGLAQATAALGLGIFVLGLLFGRTVVSDVFVLVILLGAMRSFEHPGNSALLPTLVSAEQYPRAMSLTTSGFQTATILGPAIGGLLYALGPVVPFIFAGTAYGASALLVSGLKSTRITPPREPVTLDSVFSGFRFIFARPIILGSISLDMVAVLLGGVTALLPIYARDILNTTPLGLGILRSGPAAGALVTSLILTRFPVTERVGIKMFGAVIAFGLATIVFALSESFALSLAALVALGAADVVSVVIRSSLVQLATPDDMRGRVASVNSLFIGTSNQLGEFESGVTAGLFGPVLAAALGGIGTVLAALVWMGLFPALRHADRFPK